MNVRRFLSALFLVIAVGATPIVAVASTPAVHSPVTLESVPAFAADHLGLQFLAPTHEEELAAVPEARAVAAAAQFGTHVLEARLVDVVPRSGPALNGQVNWTPETLPKSPVWVISLADQPALSAGGPGFPQPTPVARTANLVLVNGLTGAVITDFGATIPADAD